MGLSDIRDLREIATLAFAMDTVSRNELAPAMDVLAQRILAIQLATERRLVGQGRDRGIDPRYFVSEPHYLDRDVRALQRMWRQRRWCPWRGPFVWHMVAYAGGEPQ